MVLHTSTALAIGKVINVASIGIFAGQALFLNAITMPVLRRVPSQTALPIWADTYHLAKNIQLSLVGLSFASALAIYYKTENPHHLIPSLLLTTVVPYTFAFIMPVNKTLLGILDGSGKTTQTVEELFNKWDLLHFGRTVLSSAAFVLALYGSYSGKTIIRF
ncbi:hypothetical protein BGZ94_005276 [Podila epigama]|nr:hypothetical protein BGZ94_005276 [Podila epigama]